MTTPDPKKRNVKKPVKPQPATPKKATPPKATSPKAAAASPKATPPKATSPKETPPPPASRARAKPKSPERHLLELWEGDDFDTTDFKLLTDSDDE